MFIFYFCRPFISYTRIMYSTRTKLPKTFVSPFLPTIIIFNHSLCKKNEEEGKLDDLWFIHCCVKEHAEF